MPITSPNNESLKEVRKLAGRKWRDKTRTFVAEGEDLIDGGRAAGWKPELLLCEAGSGLAGEEVARRTCSSSISQLGSGTRALAVYPQRWAPAPAGPVCVALWGVNDPGNVGTVLRSALAFGAGSVALGPGTADPYGHKAVRASMGAIFARAGRARRATSASCPAARSRWRPAAAARWPSSSARRGDARGRRRARGARRRACWRLQRDGAHPDPVGVAQRRDGGDDRRSTKSLGWRAHEGRRSSSCRRRAPPRSPPRPAPPSWRRRGSPTSAARPSCRTCCAASRSSPPEERGAVGRAANEARKALEAAVEARRARARARRARRAPRRRRGRRHAARHAGRPGRPAARDHRDAARDRGHLPRPRLPRRRGARRSRPSTTTSTRSTTRRSTRRG